MTHDFLGLFLGGFLGLPPDRPADTPGRWSTVSCSSRPCHRLGTTCREGTCAGPACRSRHYERSRPSARRGGSPWPAQVC